MECECVKKARCGVTKHERENEQEPIFEES
jgi:hypothetical protein